MQRPILVLLLTGLLVLGGSSGTGAEEAYREGAAANGGSLTGEAIFAGPPPEPYVIWVKKNADVFGEKLPDERLLVSRGGKIKNVVVTLEGIREGKPWSNAQRPQVFNKGGLFVPHGQVVRAGAQLEVINKDPVLHNSHAYLAGRTVFNLAQPNKDQVIRKALAKVGLVELMCDSHDWMNAWIVVSAHPYVAITGEDGAYTITDIPPGTYTLTAWHEKLGKKQVQVTVKGREERKVNFTFPAK